ncbi:hypothetical protein F511_41094 [Dorcoceras hygrometricum]|uniref:Uncharacterized protein n=1 Tax=Dorcoceras hygrometricum TaxID=472368 RepID=A0A2Z7C380_9LAMI|nr:hypothetical protein F511_41094 [Dorcoceras hygrometricum]
MGKKVEAEVEHLVHQVDEMGLVLDRFQRMNPSTFSDAEGCLLVEGWLKHMEDLFDRIKYDEDRRLSLAMRVVINQVVGVSCFGFGNHWRELLSGRAVLGCWNRLEVHIRRILLSTDYADSVIC